MVSLAPCCISQDNHQLLQETGGCRGLLELLNGVNHRDHGLSIANTQVVV